MPETTKSSSTPAAADNEQVTTEGETPPNNRPKLLVGDYLPMVPLRVDVSLPGTSKASPSTPGLRVVETILLDPWVWPLRPRKVRQNPDDEALWIDDNARFLAHNLLTDLEVQGMGRTVRHFTNRAEIWSVDMQKRVMDQLRPQLQIVAAMRRRRLNRPNSKDCYGTKQNKRALPPVFTDHVDAKRIKTENNDNTAALPTEERSSTNEGQQASSPKADASRSSTDFENQSALNESKGTTVESTEKQVDSSSSLSQHLIPIHIRLSVHGVRIHDDCYWDPALSNQVTPLDYAQILGRDLNLSSEAMQAIAVDITEQLYGSTRNAQPPPPVETAEEESPVVPPTHGRTTAAWSLDARNHISHVAHLVAQHRQP